MIGLTSRLNERDETIINLQCELDRVDQAKNDVNRQGASRIKTLEYLLKQNGIDVPSQTSGNKSGITEEMDMVYIDSFDDQTPQ